jgi:hypothetical protein
MVGLCNMLSRVGADLKRSLLRFLDFFDASVLLVV